MSIRVKTANVMMLLIIAIYYLVFNYVLAQTLSSEKGKADKPVSEMMDHAHIPIPIPNGVNQPKISLQIVKDTMSGYNLHIKLKHYAMMPPPADLTSMKALMSASISTQDNVAEGHAHLYVNGEKIQRIYGPDIHLPDVLFKAGVNMITVTLNNHGHMFWTYDGKQLLATVYINSQADPFMTYQFEPFKVD